MSDCRARNIVASYVRDGLSTGMAVRHGARLMAKLEQRKAALSLRRQMVRTDCAQERPTSTETNVNETGH